MLPSASLWLGRPGSLHSSPRQAPGAEGNRLWGLRGTLLGGDVHLHVFPGARELPAGRRGTSGTLSRHDRTENRLDLATLRHCQQGVAGSQGLLLCLLWRGVSQSWLFPEMAGLGPVLGRGWVHQGSPQVQRRPARAPVLWELGRLLGWRP